MNLARIVQLCIEQGPVMRMKIFPAIFSVVIMSVAIGCSTQAGEFVDLSSRIEKLNIRQKNYTLGKVLTGTQKKMAKKNAVENTGPETFKFKDNDLYVVVEKSTDRVIILYEQYEPASRDKIRKLVGRLFFDFGDPTVMAHDKTIYWAFDENGKISEEQYLKAKKTGGPLNILATVKLDSSRRIMDDSDSGEGGSVYYIVSSEPLLKLLKVHQQ